MVQTVSSVLVKVLGRGITRLEPMMLEGFVGEH